MAYADLEPFGEEAAYWRAGMLAATMANLERNPKKRPKPFEPADFMPDPVEPDKPPASPAERYAAFRAKADSAMFAMGGRLRGDPPRKKGGRRVAESRPKPRKG